MASYEEAQSPLEGVQILLNKVVADERGQFLDLAETDNPSVNELKHIHAAVALHKGVSRGEHYHYRVIEDAYVLSGTALCVLHDFNESSATFGKTAAFLVGNKPTETIEGDAPTYYIEDGSLAQFRIMPKVWHAWWPLTEQPTVVVVNGTAGYDPTDYEKPKAAEIPSVAELVTKYGIDTH